MKDSNIQNTKIKESFSKLKINDPKIMINDYAIELIPNYWNYSFVTNFIPLLVIPFIFKMKNANLEINLLCTLATLLSIYLIIDQLISNNKLIINLQNKTITVIPNLITKLWKKEKIIEFKDAKNIYNSPDTFSPLYRRFIIKILLKDSLKMRLISTQLPENANKICTILLGSF